MKKIKKVLNRKERPTYVEKTPEDVYSNVANEFPEYTKEDIAKIGGVESQHGLLDANLAGSSSRGLFQFMPRTAEAIKPGSRDSISDINTQQDLMTEYLGRNTDRLKKIKENPTIEDAYLYHNLGPSSGKKFLTAKDNQKVTDIIPQNIIDSNPKLYNYRTVGEAKKAINQMLKERGDQAQFQPDIQDLFKGE